MQSFPFPLSRNIPNFVKKKKKKSPQASYQLNIAFKFGRCCCSSSSMDVIQKTSKAFFRTREINERGFSGPHKAAIKGKDTKLIPWQCKEQCLDIRHVE